MKKLRDQLEQHFNGLIGPGGALEEFSNVSVHWLDEWGGVCLILQVLNEHYLEEGDQSRANCVSKVEVIAAKMVGDSSHRAISDEVELLIKKVYKQIKDNRTGGTIFGADWIRNVELESKFQYGTTENGGSTYEIGHFMIEIDFEDDLG